MQFEKTNYEWKQWHKSFPETLYPGKSKFLNQKAWNINTPRNVTHRNSILYFAPWIKVWLRVTKWLTVSQAVLVSSLFWSPCLDFTITVLTSTVLKSYGSPWRRKWNVKVMFFLGAPQLPKQHYSGGGVCPRLRHFVLLLIESLKTKMCLDR